jgi:hypothetical protein
MLDLSVFKARRSRRRHTDGPEIARLAAVWVLATTRSIIVAALTPPRAFPDVAG